MQNLAKISPISIGLTPKFLSGGMRRKALYGAKRCRVKVSVAFRYTSNEIFLQRSVEDLSHAVNRQRHISASILAGP